MSEDTPTRRERFAGAIGRRALATLLVLIVVACGGDAGEQAATCRAAPSAIVSAISEGLVGDTHLSGARMIRDPERENVWLIAAEIDGPGVDNQGEVGVWATNDTSGGGLIFAVDAFAGQFSDWGRIPDPSVSEWELARGCL